MEVVGCPLCADGTPSSPYHAEAGYTAVQCGGCGLVFVTPRPTEQEMKRLYEGQDTHVDFFAQVAKRARKTAEARAALAMLARHASFGRLLEIGIGAGYFLAEARAAGWDPTGLDLDGRFVRFAREAHGLTVVEGTLRSAELPRETFDVVFHRNVLSHLAQPVEEIAKMASLLRPGGVMMLETGNVAELPGSAWRGTDALALPDHLFHFSEKTLRMLLDRTGFECLSLERFAVLDQLPPLLALRRAWPSTPSPPRGGGDTRPLPARAPPERSLSIAVARLHKRFLDAAGRALAKPGRRCSIVAVARKEAGATGAPRS